MPPDEEKVRPDADEVEDALIAMVIVCHGNQRVANTVAKQLKAAVAGTTIDTKAIRTACGAK